MTFCWVSLGQPNRFGGGRSTEAKIDIFLHKNLVRDAIKVISDNSYVQSHLI
ncbi:MULTISPECIES: hypothetical protein [unclassified Microcystis]|uniref:hypothetical protein n=1 Tax=unclassified Microcystis TaxID=2643300 RepID=UPI002584DFA9|nr:MULTISPECIES: hypothetical protein [unclassified Microcystis]